MIIRLLMMQILILIDNLCNMYILMDKEHTKEDWKQSSFFMV